MAVRRRTIWLSDEQWAKLSERAAAFSLNPSTYIGKLIEWRQPDVAFVRTGARGVNAIAGPQTAMPRGVTPFAEFRPVPKPGRK